MDDPFCYSVEAVRAQVRDAAPDLGGFLVRFYTDGGRPSRVKTDTIATFYYYPSGGTIRDADLNIVFYEPRLDTYHISSRGT